MAMTCKNYVELIGIVGAVKIQEISETKVCRVSLATNRAYRGVDNCPTITTTWLSCRFWETKSCKIPEGLQKGEKLHIIGRIDVCKYVNADGYERTDYEIVATKMEKIEGDDPLLMEESL